MLIRRHFLGVYLTLSTLFIFSGCIYYNTFFLARQKFNEAERKQEENQKARQNQQGQQNLPGGRQNQPGGMQQQGGNSNNVPADVKVLYDDAIKKAGKVLTYHPNSKWVDDALWLIGKSYFAMGDYILADSRFKELVTNQPNSKYVDRCNFYMGLCQIYLGHEDQALSAFAAIENAPKKSSYLEFVLFARGSLEFKGENYQDAEGYFEQYIKKYPGGDSAAMAQYYVGMCREKRKEYWDAHLAYKAVKKHNPSRELYFNASLASATVALEGDSVALGMKILESLGADQRYFSRAADIRLRMAEGYFLMKDLDKAMDLYRQVTSQNPKTDQSCEAFYRLGLIYQNEKFDLAAAKDAFTKAQSEYPNSQYRPLAQARLAQISRLETYQKQLGRADSLKRVDDINSWGQTALPLSGRSDSSTVGDSGKFIGPLPESPSAPGAQMKNEAVNQGSEFIGPRLEDEGGHTDTLLQVNSGDSISEKPLFIGPRLEDLRTPENPNTPQLARNDLPDFIGPRLEDLQDQVISPDTLSHKKSESFRGGDTQSDPSASQVNEDSIRQAIWMEAMETRYMLAELYSYELNRPDSALQEYLLIVKEHPESPYAPRALLAASQIEFNLKDTTAARNFLEQLLREFPNSPQAVEASELLDRPIDMSSNAMGLYAEAESLVYIAHDPDSALTLYKYIAANFPDMAAQASYAVAWVMDQVIGVEDSSAYYAYSDVSEKYPETPYGKAAHDRLTGYVAKVSRPKTGTQEEEQAPEQNPDEQLPDSANQFAGGLPFAPNPTKLGDFIYPEALLSRDLKGKVTFKLKLDMSGRVRSEEIIGPSGEVAIDSAATVALMNTEFDVTGLNLIQLDSYFIYSISFKRPNINIYNDPYLRRQESGP